MNTPNHTPTSYDPRTVALHWATAGLVLTLWALGQSIDWFPKGDARVMARSVHILLGTTLAVLIAYRLWWRITAGTRLPPAGQGAMDRAAVLTHKALYLLLIVTLGLGLYAAWVRGDNLFNLVKLPSLAPDNHELRESVVDWHGTCANILLIVAGLHAAAALFHQYVLHDNLIQRMRRTRR